MTKAETKKLIIEEANEPTTYTIKPEVIIIVSVLEFVVIDPFDRKHVLRQKKELYEIEDDDDEPIEIESISNNEQLDAAKSPVTVEAKEPTKERIPNKNNQKAFVEPNVSIPFRDEYMQIRLTSNLCSSTFPRFLLTRTR